MRFSALLFTVLMLAMAAPAFAQESDTTISLKQVVLAAEVVKNEPVDERMNFSMADKFVFCFVRYENYGMPSSLKFKWYYNDAYLFAYDAKTKTGRGLKTYSVATLQPGNWKVELIAPGGQILKTLRFKVTS